MGNWILDFFKKLAEPTAVEKQPELSLKFGDLVNIKLDPENKAIYLEDQDSKPGDVDLLLYYLKPQIDGHQIIETPHVEVQLDPNRKATAEELETAKTAYEAHKKELQDYKDGFKKKESSSHDMSEKEMLEMTISLLEDEIKRERDHERLKSLQDDLEHSKMHLQTMASQIKEAAKFYKGYTLFWDQDNGGWNISNEVAEKPIATGFKDQPEAKAWINEHPKKEASLDKSAGDIGWNSSDSVWYRVWVDEGELRYDDKVEAIVKSKDTDAEKKKKVIERAKEIAEENLHKVDQLAGENNLGVQFYHLWAGDIYMDRLDWDNLLHPDTYETESSLKKKAAETDFTDTVIEFHDSEVFVSDDFRKKHPEAWEALKYYSTSTSKGSIGFPGKPLRGYDFKLKETWEFLEVHVEELEGFKTSKAEQVPLSEVFDLPEKREKESPVGQYPDEEFDPKTVEVLSPAERRKRTDQLLDEYKDANPERKEYITRQLQELRASLDINSLFKDWWKKYKNEQALKEAYTKYSEEVKAADIPVPEYKDWAKEQYNELAGFSEKKAEKDPNIEKKKEKAQSLLLNLISDGFKTDSLMNLFQYVALKSGSSPESVMDIFDQLLHTGRIVEQMDKVMVRSASLQLVSRVVHKKDGWYVLSEEGKNLGGPYGSKDKAKHRLQQVEYFKHQGQLKEEFNLINRTARTKEEAEILRAELLKHAAEQYPLDKEISELVDIIDQLSVEDTEITSQIGPDRVLELQAINKVFKDYLDPKDTFIPSRMVLENLDRANEILGL